MIKGIPASAGIAIAHVFKHLIKDRSETYVVESQAIEKEKLECALGRALDQIHAIRIQAETELGQEEARIFEAHEMLLKDPEIIGKIEEGIKVGLGGPEAVGRAQDSFEALFSAMDNPYLQERAADIRDVLGRVRNNLLGQDGMIMQGRDEPVILLCHDLTPSDTAQMSKKSVLGFITEIGGAASHSAIMARKMEMPAVVGVSEIMDTLEDGTLVIVDGGAGVVIADPSQETLDSYRKKKRAYDQKKEALGKMKGLSSTSLCGRRVEIACNIAGPEDIALVLENDGEGVGLFRSEFLYMDRDSLPTEEQQFQAYKKVVEGLADRPVIIRTLDVGGDKNIPYLNMKEEMNPFLGYRAIRYCLNEEAVFMTQLRAILRASAYGKAKIMFPMISSIEEIRCAKAYVASAMAALKHEKIAYDTAIEIGMMIEIPSAAMLSDLFAKEVDFFSIGTNDLVQYTVAVDRMNQQISDLYTPMHPSVLRLVHMVIENGHKAGIWVGMCGEAAGIEALVPLWFAMGLDEFSVSPSAVLRVREQIRSFNKNTLGDLVDTVLELPTANAVKQRLRDVL